MELREEDLEVTTGCLAAHPDKRGGQHTGRCTAVRIQHVPTGIEVVSRNHRSQIGNKVAALKMLRAAIAADAEKPMAIRWIPTDSNPDAEMNYYEASVGICTLTVWRRDPSKEWMWEVEINAAAAARGLAATADEAQNNARDWVVEMIVKIQGDL